MKASSSARRRATARSGHAQTGETPHAQVLTALLASGVRHALPWPVHRRKLIVPQRARHEDGDAIAVVASKGGEPTHPAWFHNLKANPDTTMQIGSVFREVRAGVATDEERDRLRPEFVAIFPGYDFYQRHAKGRKIPIVMLGPRS